LPGAVWGVCGGGIVELFEDCGAVAADLMHFEIEVVCGLSDGAAGLEEGLGDLSAGVGPFGLVCDDEDEDGVCESCEGAADSAADLSWVLVSEACDLCG